MSDEFASADDDTQFRDVSLEDLRGAKDVGSREAAELADRAQARGLRENLFTTVVRLVIWQIAIADGLFATYLLIVLLAEHRAPDGSVMIAWVSGTVVEVIGILYIIARYLFPDRRGIDHTQRG